MQPKNQIFVKSHNNVGHTIRLCTCHFLLVFVFMSRSDIFSYFFSSSFSCYVCPVGSVVPSFTLSSLCVCPVGSSCPILATSFFLLYVRLALFVLCVPVLPWWLPTFFLLVFLRIFLTTPALSSVTCSSYRQVPASFSQLYFLILQGVFFNWLHP